MYIKTTHKKRLLAMPEQDRRSFLGWILLDRSCIFKMLERYPGHFTVSGDDDDGGEDLWTFFGDEEELLDTISFLRESLPKQKSYGIYR